MPLLLVHTCIGLALALQLTLVCTCALQRKHHIASIAPAECTFSNGTEAPPKPLLTVTACVPTCPSALMLMLLILLLPSSLCATTLRVPVCTCSNLLPCIHQGQRQQQQVRSTGLNVKLHTAAGHPLVAAWLPEHTCMHVGCCCCCCCCLLCA
jgi:hypothetical protein